MQEAKTQQTVIKAVMERAAIRRTWPALTLLWMVGSSVAEEPLPPPIEALKHQGIEIYGAFDAPGGLTGYGALDQGRETAVYLLPDGEHAIVGTLTDANGNDVSANELDTHLRVPLEAETWRLLEASHWIQDGDPEAPRLVYLFTDPNCPYCREFWQRTRPAVAEGRLQLRHIMVGFMAPQSPAQAASLLAAEDPEAALNAHEGGTPIEASAQPRAIEEQVYHNNQLFDALGLHATPTLAYQRETPTGLRIVRIQGLPDAPAWEAMIEPADEKNNN